jgi:hypothetical protein
MPWLCGIMEVSQALVWLHWKIQMSGFIDSHPLPPSTSASGRRDVGPYTTKVRASKRIKKAYRSSLGRAGSLKSFARALRDDMENLVDTWFANKYPVRGA